MYLQTDDQTIGDLRLFSKRDHSGIYDIYNNTSTRGGEEMLEHMFRNPLSSQEAITNRATIIASLAQLNTCFPFRASLLDSVEKFMADDKEGKDGQRAVLGEKEISNGVTSMIELLHAMREFVQKGDLVNVPALNNEREKMLSLLSTPALKPVFNEKPPGRLSYAAVTAFDLLLRVRERDKILSILQFIYLMDVYISVAQVSSKHNFIFPTVHPKGSNVLRVEGVYHPELKNPVPNSLAMGAEKSVVFLTGANMAGKSTFLRSFSTAVYIAHMGFPVAAGSMEFSVMDGVYTTINLPDNLGIGASHFYAEVLRVKKMAAELGTGKSIFVLFDELFRGTNVKDAHEGTVALTKAFAQKKNSMFIISSHIVEAADELKEKSNIGFHYLPTRMNGTVPEYTYTLEEGITDDRHGMIIIRNEGILDILKRGKKNG
ncbi:MutS-related protein [Pseudobacter ginsenosidimutans]|uniref:MutS-like protein n=1 Tax=Pseudobacter ginsenosidimutans TaxID=661488 RepID=A0A4Q7N6B4_9BACT|nr:DNA mismatch repair protein [Pseudobacter ginsenosidimutans]QEC45125.1 DNA mismatch repair protein [Pseudobacter ginsenosidimutans]RZS76621.1 MutS-like protein [Pseudobacter ginsenosidimutans]